MIFEVDFQNIIFENFPIYIIEEDSFSFKNWNQNINFSVMIGKSYNSLDVSLASGCAIQLSGYNSRETWLEKKLPLLVSKKGILKVKFDFKPLSGAGEYYTENWDTYYDKNTGWVCIGNLDEMHDYLYIEFAKNTVAVVNNNQLAAIYVNPIFI